LVPPARLGNFQPPDFSEVALESPSRIFPTGAFTAVYPVANYNALILLYFFVAKSLPHFVAKLIDIALRRRYIAPQHE
jgi:hypothetical protein